MLKRRIIPCLDVHNGRVVKGVHFKGLRDAGDPIEAARAESNRRALKKSSFAAGKPTARTKDSSRSIR